MTMAHRYNRTARPTGEPKRCIWCHHIGLLCRCTTAQRGLWARERAKRPPIRLLDAAGYTGTVPARAVPTERMGEAA